MYLGSRSGIYATLTILIALLAIRILVSIKISQELHPIYPATLPLASDMAAADFRIFNRLADQMNYYHSILRSSWDELYAGTAVDSRVSTKKLVQIGLHFCQHLKSHHDIEETYWFPILGRKMEGFRPGHFAQEQHKEMHKGLDVLTAYLQACGRKERDMSRSEVKSILDSFGGILWTHMDEEVKELGADNMRKYWSKEEIGRFPF